MENQEEVPQSGKKPSPGKEELGAMERLGMREETGGRLMGLLGNSPSLTPEKRDLERAESAFWENLKGFLINFPPAVETSRENSNFIGALKAVFPVSRQVFAGIAEALQKTYRLSGSACTLNLMKNVLEAAQAYDAEGNGRRALANTKNALNVVWHTSDEPRFLEAMGKLIQSFQAEIS